MIKTGGFRIIFEAVVKTFGIKLNNFFVQFLIFEQRNFAEIFSNFFTKLTEIV